MTEVPEHLLRRSRERRAALGLGGGEEGAEAPAASGAEVAVPAESAASSAAAPSSAPAPVAAAAPPAPAEEAAPSPMLLAGEAVARTRVPLWVMPVLLALPFWGFLYLGAFGDRSKSEVVDPLVLGQQLYRGEGCSSCHGAAGEGGVGPPLAEGEAALTFPEEADHAAWIKSGSGAMKGQLYGDPNRPGGQRGPAKGVMPGYPSLSDKEIEALVLYEREEL